MNFSSSKFDTFLSILDFVNTLCCDVEIKNGMILQRTTNKAYTIEIDMRPLFGDNVEELKEIRFNGLKSKLNLFSAFRMKDPNQNISFSGTDDYYKISNSVISDLSLRIPASDVMENKYDEESAIDIKEDELCFKKNLPSSILGLTKNVVDEIGKQPIVTIFDTTTNKISCGMQSFSKNVVFYIVKNEDFDINKYGDGKPAYCKINKDLFFSPPKVDNLNMSIYRRGSSITVVFTFEIDSCTISIKQKCTLRLVDMDEIQNGTNIDIDAVNA